MKHFTCQNCGCESRTQITECPLCGHHDILTTEDTMGNSDADKKEHELMEAALEELDKYEEGLEPVPKEYYNSGE